MNLLKKLPISLDSFDAIIDRGCVYVDKTDLVAELAQDHGHYLLTRPRRFGKTTLIGTFHELFANGLERFKGLKIERDGLYTDTKTYKVLHFDFSDCTGAVNVRDYLRYELTNVFKLNGIDFDYQGDPCFWLERVLSREADGSIVLLIDEYDAPLTHVLDDPAEFAKRIDIWRSFYGALKEVSSRLRFLFVTGIARYSNESIFSGFNNIIELSLDPRFVSLLGYTQDELECYFGDYIERAACELNRVNNTDQYTSEAVLQLLKQHYRGYCFDENASTLVYNPWSILNFLEKPASGFESYWIITGPVWPSILVEYLGSQVGAGFEFERFLESDRTLTISEHDLRTDLGSQDSSEFPVVPMLYQTGYLTIKYGSGGLELVAPNQEVSTAFSSIIMGFLKKKIGAGTYHNKFEFDLELALKQQQFETVKSKLNQLIAAFSTEALLRFDDISFRGLLRVALHSVDATDFQSETPDAEDSSELRFDFGDVFFVCELKLASNLSEVDSKLVEAENLLVTKAYNNLIGVKKVVPLAIVAVNQNNAQGVEAVRRFEVIKPLEHAGA